MDNSNFITTLEDKLMNLATDQELKMNSENTFTFFQNAILLWRNNYLSVLVTYSRFGKLKHKTDRNKPEYLRHFCSLRQMAIGKKLKAEALVIG